MKRTFLSIALLLFAAAPAMALADSSPRHLRVRVTLHNGAKLLGIVRGGVLYETMRRDGSFVRAAGPNVRGAGFRLWHVADSPGYLWVRYRDVKKFERIALMTPKELHSMESDLRRRAGVIVMPYKKPEPVEEGEEPTVPGVEPAPVPDPKTPAIGPPLPPVPPADEADKDAGDADAEPKPETPGERLLRLFPPTEGWLPERRDEIERRKWVLGVFPTPQEKQFLDNYPEWKEAYDAWLHELIKERATQEPQTKSKTKKKSVVAPEPVARGGSKG